MAIKMTLDRTPLCFRILLRLLGLDMVVVIQSELVSFRSLIEPFFFIPIMGEIVRTCPDSFY